ncbi:hypothetical protein FB451DRAFT_1391597 [Mycena latifolia]|nr:hypothetical protein FB451DRAFT_1391597 [Mycena latifolia]
MATIDSVRPPLELGVYGQKFPRVLGHGGSWQYLRVQGLWHPLNEWCAVSVYRPARIRCPPRKKAPKTPGGLRLMRVALSLPDNANPSAVALWAKQLAYLREIGDIDALDMASFSFFAVVFSTYPVQDAPYVITWGEGSDETSAVSVVMTVMAARAINVPPRDRSKAPLLVVGEDIAVSCCLRRHDNLRDDGVLSMRYVLQGGFYSKLWADQLRNV